MRTIRRQVPPMFQYLIGALVLSKLDYCNSVLFGLPANLVQRLRSVQNAAARLIFRIRWSELQNTLHQRSSDFTGCESKNVSPENWQLWRIDPSTAPFRPTYSHVSPVFLTWHPNDGCGLLPHIVWTFRPFVSPQSTSGRFRGFWCHRLERPATSCLVSSITFLFIRIRFHNHFRNPCPHCRSIPPLPIPCRVRTTDWKDTG